MIAKCERGLAQAFLYRCDRENITADVINCTNQQDQTPLTLGVVSNQVGVVQMLVRRGVDTNKQCHVQTSAGLVHYRPIHKAVDKGQKGLPVTVTLMRDPRTDLDACDSEGRTPIMRSIEVDGTLYLPFEGEMGSGGMSQGERNPEMIDSKLVILNLLMNGADLSKQNSSSGKAVIHYIVEKKNPEFLHWFLMLVKTGAPPQAQRKPCPPLPTLRDFVNARTNQNVSALQLAVGSGVMSANQVQLVKLLLQAGAELLKNGDNDLKRKLMKNLEISALLKGLSSRRNSSKFTSSPDSSLN
jgi:hypothetical protein